MNILTRILSVLLAAILLLGTVACTKENPSANDSTQDTPAVTTPEPDATDTAASADTSVDEPTESVTEATDDTPAESVTEPPTETVHPEDIATLEIDGKVIDCGTTPALIVHVPPEKLENGLYVGGDVACLPLLVTLRTLGMEVGEVTDGKVRIVAEGVGYTLSITDKALTRDGDPNWNLLITPPNGARYVESVGDELMVDSATLLAGVLYFMAPSESNEHRLCRMDRQTGVIRIERRAA